MDDDADTPLPVLHQSNGRRKRAKVPLNMRKRVKMACESCRRHKWKCDGQSPCSRCAGAESRKQRLCRYLVPSSAHPSLASSSDGQLGCDKERLRLLESLFTKLHPEVATDPDTLRSYHSRIESQRSSRPSSRASYRDTPQDGDREESPAAGSEDQDMAHLDTESLVLGSTPMPAASTTVVNQGKTHFEGRFSYWTFFSSVRQAVADDAVEVEQLDEADCDDSIHRPSIANLDIDWKTAVLSSLPPREVVDFLVSTFFRSAQANHFYIHPEIFSRKLTAFYNGSHEFDAQNSGNSRRSVEFIGVLFMVFAIGSQFADLETSAVENGLRGNNESSSSFLDGAESENFDFGRITIPTPSPSPGWRFYEVSRRLLSDIICLSSMASVQVCILQGIFLPSTKSRDAGYNLLGLALRMAINMGLHRSFTGNSLHRHVREMRNRLWWSVYVAERLFSVEMGRPLSINDAEIDAPFPVDIPEWNFAPGSKQPTNVDNLIAMAKLCQLLGKIVEGVYCKPAASLGVTEEGSTIIRPKVFRNLKRELEQSRRDLPPHLKLGNTPSRSVAHIALFYEQATILLTRSCLNYAHAAGSSDAGSVTTEAMRFLQQQTQDCMNAAVASIRLLSSLRSLSLLCRFSFHDSLYCTAALYVLLLAEKLGLLGITTRSYIRHGILILRDLAKGSEFAASSLRSIIRGFQSCRTDRHETSSSVFGPGSCDEEARRERGRQAWKAWMTQSGSPELAEPRSGRNHIQGQTLGAAVSDRGANWMGNHFQFPHSDISEINSPNMIDERASDISDLQPFWILDNTEFDILSRDLSSAPGIPIF